MNHPLVPTAPAPLAKPPPGPGFIAGMGAIFSGIGFVASTPAVWPLAMVPMVVGLGLTVGFSVLAIKFIPPLFAAWLGATSGLLATVLGVLATILAMILGVIVGFGLAQPLSGVALEGIVRRAEAKDGASAWPAVGFLDNLGRSLASVFVSAGFALPLLAILFVVGFIFPPAVVVTMPLKFAVLALLAAWDLCDYPLSLRGVPIRERVAFMVRNAGAMIGFGLSLALISLVPCMLILVLPAGVAGAARLVLALERAEGRRLGPG